MTTQIRDIKQCSYNLQLDAVFLSLNKMRKKNVNMTTQTLTCTNLSSFYMHISDIYIAID